MAIDLDMVAIEGKREEYREYIEEHINNVKHVWKNIVLNEELRNFINQGKRTQIFRLGGEDGIMWCEFSGKANGAVVKIGELCLKRRILQ